MAEVVLHPKAVFILDKYKEWERTDRDIIEMILEPEGNSAELLKYADFQTVIKALTHGYVSEDSPEVLIKKYYKEAEYTAEEARREGNKAELDQSIGRMDGVKFVLNRLDKTISGINDEGAN